MTIVALLVFFWRRYGPGSGRAFGNRVAAHIGIRRHVFRTLLDNGVNGSSRELLASLEKSNVGLDQAGIALAPSLSRGVERLEARFGPQAMIDEAKPVVARLAALADRPS